MQNGAKKTVRIHAERLTFPPEEASAVVAAVEERRRVEAGIMSEINTAPREMTWVKRILETAGETISDPFEKSC